MTKFNDARTLGGMQVLQVEWSATMPVINHLYEPSLSLPEGGEPDMVRVYEESWCNPANSSCVRAEIITTRIAYRYPS